MVAIATDPLKIKFIDLLFNEANIGTDSHEFFIGIGKSDQYDSANDNIITPLRHLRDEREARNNVESVMKVPTTNVSFVVPRHNWTSGTIYSAYSDHVVGYPTNTYYVLTEDNQVYICLQASKDASGNANTSTVKPDFATQGVDKRHAFKTSDGYIWRFLYEISTTRNNLFLTSSFMPTQFIDSNNDTTATEVEQLSVRAEALARGNGQILGAEIVNAGAGYSSAPTIAIKGDGNGAVATCTVSGGQIAKVEMTCNISDSGMGSGYNVARMEISGGGSPTENAILRPIIGPRDGLGADTRIDLKSSSLMAVVKPSGTQSGNFNITNDFRQITLFRNLRRRDSSGGVGFISKDTSARANRVLTLQGNLGSLVADQKITGDSGTVAWIDQVDSNGSGKGLVYYHTNNQFAIHNKGPGVFSASETITGASAGTGIVATDSSVALNPYSGELLYIDSRARIVRSADQTEDIKVILTV